MPQLKAISQKIGVIILAAGASKRMGQPKQLLPFHDAPLLQHTINEASKLPAHGHWLVLGAHADKIQKAIDLNSFQVIINDQWQEGMGSSLRTAVKEASKQPEVQHLIILLSDQPYVSASYLNKLISTHMAGNKNITASYYSNMAGVPAIFSQAIFEDLQRLEGDKGARKIIQHTPHNSVDFAEGSTDIDTPDDWDRLNS